LTFVSRPQPVHALMRSVARMATRGRDVEGFINEKSTTADAAANYIADFARRITARRLVLRPRVALARFTAVFALRRLPPRPATLPAV
jgi:hypothetical protein